MLTVTDDAKQMLIQMLDNANAPQGKAARFITDGQQMQLTLDDPQEEDAKVEHDGRTLLILSPQVSSLLDGQELDKVETEKGAGLTLREAAA